MDVSVAVAVDVAVDVDVAVVVAVAVAVALSVSLDIALPLRPPHCLPSKYWAVLYLVFAPSGAVDSGEPKDSSHTAPSNGKDGRR